MHNAHCQSSFLVQLRGTAAPSASADCIARLSSDLSLLFSTLENFEEVHSFESARAVDALPLKGLLPLRFYLPSFWCLFAISRSHRRTVRGLTNARYSTWSDQRLTSLSTASPSLDCYSIVHAPSSAKDHHANAGCLDALILFH